MVGSLFIKGILPVSDFFRAYALFGVSYLEATAKYSSENYNESVSDSQDDTNVAAGVGAEFDLNEKVSINGDFIRHSIGVSNYDFDSASLGVTYYF